MVAPGASHLGTRDLDAISGGAPRVFGKGPHPLQHLLEEIPRCRRAQMLEAVITTESEKMKIPRVLETDESSRHGRKAYNQRDRMSSQNRQWAAKLRTIPGAQKRGTWGNHPSPENSFFFPGTWASPREMKRVVLNRKNSLFVGNARGGRTAAILASLASTCRRHDIDPQLYLTQLLVNLPSLRISDLPDWLPDRWKAAQNVGLAGLA